MIKGDQSLMVFWGVMTLTERHTHAIFKSQLTALEIRGKGTKLKEKFKGHKKRVVVRDWLWP